MKNKGLLLLLCVLLGGLVVRLYGISHPLADWHSWRQSDTSSVSRNFVQNGYDVFKPRFDDLSNIPSGLDNPQGYRFVEFPIYNLLQAGFYDIFRFFSLEVWGRIITIAFSLAGVYFLYKITSVYSTEKVALLAAFFYAFLPFSIYYGRVILPDTAMVSMILGGLFFFHIYLEQSKSKKTKKALLFFTLSLFFTIVSLLLKPYALFFALPFVALAYQHYKLKVILQWRLWLYAILAVIPLLFWRQWMTQFPEGIPANTWLFNGNGIRFRPSFFRWMLFERLTKLIVGYVGIVFIITSVLELKKSKSILFFASFLLSAVLYVVVLATGNVQHDYYQIVILPSIVLLLAFGSSYVYAFFMKFISQKLSLFAVGSLIFLSFYFSWKVVQTYYWINNPTVVSVGRELDKNLPKDALVVAPYTGDTTFLYHINRKGWPSFENGIPSLINKGADYLVIINPKPEDEGIKTEYFLEKKTDDYLLFNLKKSL